MSKSFADLRRRIRPNYRGVAGRTGLRARAAV
jgi:hypothetical protein